MPTGLSPQALVKFVFEWLLAVTGPKPAIVVAFSGGLDSTVLAHMLVARRRKLAGLRLAHVDHGLQDASREWSLHCHRQARQWSVPFIALQASISKKRGESLEALARDAR